MCTLTLLPLEDEHGRCLRIAFNRDESRLRPTAIPPHRLHFGERTALMPVDPASGGTWIAASDAGIALSVMNINPGDRLDGASTQSRGKIIPSLLHCTSVDEMLAKLSDLSAVAFAPFRLLIASLEGLAVVEHHGKGGQILSRPPLSSPLMFTSSGLGDSLVEGPRRDLFESMLLPHPAPRNQDAFHRHTWPDRPHLSICMARPDARTVSHTVIYLSSMRARLTYLRDSPDQPAQPESHLLQVAATEFLCM
jgi:hypothetical protein